MADLKRHRFGRSTEKHEIEDQISFMEVDGKVVFFNESEAVAAEENAPDFCEPGVAGCPSLCLWLKQRMLPLYDAVSFLRETHRPHQGTCMGRGRLAPVIQAALGKPVPVAAHPGGGA